MGIDIGTVAKIAGEAGNFNPTIKKASSGYNFLQSVIASVVLLLVGIFFLFSILVAGLVIILIAAGIFILSLKKVKRVRGYLKMREDLLSGLTDDEKVSVIFTDIDNGASQENNQKTEIENVMILTDKRIIFLYVPRLGIGDITSGHLIQKLGQAGEYTGLQKKVESEIKESGLRNLVSNSRRAFSMNYTEISEVKIRDVLSKIIFHYRGRRYKYFVLKEQLGQFRKIFSNYIKN